MDKNAKQKKRTNHWNKRVCVTEESYDYINDVRNEKEYRTLSGTLDHIINFYREIHEEKERISKAQRGKEEGLKEI